MGSVPDYGIPDNQNPVRHNDGGTYHIPGLGTPVVVPPGPVFNPYRPDSPPAVDYPPLPRPLTDSPAGRIARCSTAFQKQQLDVAVTIGSTVMVLPGDRSRVMWWLTAGVGETFAIGGVSGPRLLIAATGNPPGFVCTIDQHYIAVQDELWIVAATGNKTLQFYIAKASI